MLDFVIMILTMWNCGLLDSDLKVYECLGMLALSLVSQARGAFFAFAGAGRAARLVTLAFFSGSTFLFDECLIVP